MDDYNDIQTLINNARAQRSAALAKILADGIFVTSVWLKKTLFSIAAGVLEAFSTFARVNEAWAQSAQDKMRDDYFSGSANLADLEIRQRKWEQNHFSKYVYD